MAVLLLILKIIGIILLILLGLILLILAVVLFVPVRYQVSGSIGEKTTVRIAVSWLLHAGGQRTKRKGFLHSCGSLGSPGKEKSRTMENPGRMTGRTVQKNPKSAVRQMPPWQTVSRKQKASWQTGSRERRNGSTRGRRRKSAPGRRSRILRSIRNWNKRIRLCAESSAAGCFGGYGSVSVHSLQDLSELRQFRAGIKEALKKIKDVRTFLTDERHREALPLIFTELKYLLTHFKFRRIRTDLTFSMGDPALTGQVLGGLCMLPFLYRYQVQVYPDFEAENTYVTGTFDIKGRARGLHIAVSAVRLLGKKEFRIWLKWLMHR